MQFTNVEDVVQYLARGGTSVYIANNANSNSHSYADFGQNGDYAVPTRVKSDPFKLQAGTDNFSHDDWEVFYLG